jgi:hypothetical protein
MEETPGRFYLTYWDEESEQDVVARAFLWLKRRVEESRTSGILAIPRSELLESLFNDAFGSRLVEILRDERRLPLGHGLSIAWTTFEGLQMPSSGPVAAFSPDRETLDNLAAWPAIVLVVGTRAAAIDDWVQRTRAFQPSAENFWPGGRAPAPKQGLRKRVSRMMKGR